MDYEFFHVGGSLVVFDAAGCALRQCEVDADSFSVCIADTKRLYSGESLTFEIIYPFIRSPLTRGWEMENDFGLWCQLSPSGGVKFAG